MYICLFMIVLGMPVQSLAAFTDVPTNSWFSETVNSLQQQGYFSREGIRFRPGDNATRAEFVQLMIDVQGGIRQASPQAPNFDDVSLREWFFPYIEEAARLRWMKGDGDCYGTHPCIARPNGSINRAEAAALIARSFGFESLGTAPYFPDNTVGAWYMDVIQTAADHCILKGDDRTKYVRPSDTMNRAEMAAIVDRARQHLTYGVDCGEIAHATPHIQSITPLDKHIVVIDFNADLNPGSAGDTLRYALKNTTAVQVIAATLVRDNGVELRFNKDLEPGKRYTLSVSNMLTKDGKPFLDTGTFTGFVPLEETDGTLDVRVSAAQLQGQGLPKGALRMPMLSLEFSASCDGGVSIQSLSLVREGQGLRTDIDGVYALVNGERITRKRSIEAKEGTVTLYFPKPLIVEACKKVTVDVVADFETTAQTSSQHRFALRSVNDIQNNAKRVRGTFPLQGPTFSVAAVKTGTVSVEYRSVTPSSLEVGQKTKVVGRMQISTDSVERQTLYSMLLQQDGSIKAGDLENVRLRRSDGTPLTKVVQRPQGEYILLAFNPPFTVSEGDKMTLEVVADIMGGAGRTIQMGLEEESDLFAIGSVFGKAANSKTFGSRVSISTSSEPTIVAIDAGGFTVEVDGPSQQTYASDDRGAVLAKVLLTSGDEPVNVRSMYALVLAQNQQGAGLGGGSSASDDEIHELLKSVKLRNTVTGKTVSAVRLTGSNDAQTTASKTYQIYRLDEFVVRGKQLWEFQVDFTNNGAGNHPFTGDKFRVFLCGEPQYTRTTSNTLVANGVGCDFGGVLSSKQTAYQMRVEGLSTGDRIGDVRPRGSIAGNFHSIADATLTIAVQDMGDTAIAVRSAKNVPLLRFETRASSVRDILLTRLSFEAQAGSLLNGQNYTLWVDTNGDSEVDTILETGVAAQGGLVTFNRLVSAKSVVPASATRVFEVRSSISSSPINTQLQLRFATTTANYVEAEKVDGANISGIKTNGVCSGTTCDIAVSTVVSVVVTIGDQGNLFVTKASTPVRARQLLGGALSDAVLRLRFRANTEPVDITAIRITSSGSTANSIDRLELYKVGDSKPFALATGAGCGSVSVITLHQGQSVQTFCASMKNQQLVIPGGSDTDILVRAYVKSDTSGGTRGQLVQFWLSPDAFGNESAIQGRGLSSSSDLAFNDGDNDGEGEVFIGRSSAGASAAIVGEKNTVVMSKVSSITNANTDPNGTAIPVGSADIGKFRFAASANGNSNNGLNDVIIDKILFTVTASNVTLDASEFRIANTASSGIEEECTALDSSGTPLSGGISGSFYVSCTGLQSAVVSSVISQGQSAVFLLRGLITNPSGAGKNATLQVSLQAITDQKKTAFGVSDSHIELLDSDGAGSPSVFWVELDDSSVNSTSYRN